MAATLRSVVMAVADRLLRIGGAEHPVELARRKLADELGAVGGDQRARASSQLDAPADQPRVEAEALQSLGNALIDAVPARPSADRRS
jgi:hypothetical protein